MNIADILNRLPSEGFALAGEISAKIEALKQSFASAKIDDSRTLNELQADIGWWRFKKYRLIQRFSADTNALNTAIGLLLDDYVALAQCSEEERLIVSTFKESQKMTAELSAFVQSDVPVKLIFDRLLDAAKGIRASLGDAGKK